VSRVARFGVLSRHNMRVTLSDQPPDLGTEPAETSGSRTRSLRPNLTLALALIGSGLSTFIHSSGMILRRLLNVPRAGFLRKLQPLGIVAILFLGVATIGPPWNGSARDIPIYIMVAIGITFVILPLWAVSRKKYSALFASIFGWVPVTLGALSYPFWYWYANGYGSGYANLGIGNEFFHAAADTLPVLLLATVIDVRRTNELEGKQLVPPIAAVFFGELAALNALAFTEGDMIANFAVVSSSLVTATFALIIAVMADLSPSDEGSDARESQLPKAQENETIVANPAAPEPRSEPTSATG
jgi:hypothetical protein